MDILISSNLERLLFELVQRDAERVKALMNELQETGVYRLPPDLVQELGRNFWGGYATETETRQAMAEVFAGHHYVIDPHTAVGYKVYQDYIAQTGDKTPTVIASTASPYKFPSSVAQAIIGKEQTTGEGELALLQEISGFTGTPIPEPLRNLGAKPIRHHKVVPVQDMEETVREILFAHQWDSTL
jgi:threonine synthase